MGRWEREAHLAQPRRRRTRRRPPRGRGGGREESLPNVRGSSGSCSNVGREGLGLAFSSVHAAAVFGPVVVSLSLSQFISIYF